jgi:glucose/arabinose dehydrogenase
MTWHLRGIIATLAMLAPFAACDKKDTPTAQPAAQAEPAAKPAPEQAAQAAPSGEAAPSAPAAPAAAATPAAPATPSPAPAAPAEPATGFKPNEVMVTPGTVVRDPKEGTPEWLVAQVLLAAMDPDEAKGWERFVSVLGPDQKIEKALISRRELNFAASRRKVKLFLFEDPTKPIYKVDRVQQEEENVWRIFVHNNSPDSMPTPCQVRFDPATSKWGVGLCSL